MMRFYVDAVGNYLGGFDANPPAGAIEVPAPPPLHASQTWDGSVWSSYAPPTDADLADGEFRRNPALRALVSQMAVDKGVTVEQMISDLKVRT